MPPRVAIVIPCFNVEKQIGGVLESIPAQYSLILCVDDCSSDGTAAVIEALRDPRVVLIRHAQNRGVGGAMKSGYREALARGATVCVKMDGDGQMSAADLNVLIAPALEGAADYSKGNRFAEARSAGAMPHSRRIGNAALTLLGKAASGYWHVSDVPNGFTAIDANVLRRLDFNHLDDGYFFETSMLIELNIAGARVEEVPLPARYGNERSSMRLRNVLVRFPFLLARGAARRYLRRGLQQGLRSKAAVPKRESR